MITLRVLYITPPRILPWRKTYTICSSLFQENFRSNASSREQVVIASR
jgi:hypothetical protein